MNNFLFEQEIRDFILKEKGYFVGATADASFVSLLRNLLHKQLNLDASRFFLQVPNPSALEKSLRDALEEGFRPLLLLDRLFRGQDMTTAARTLKRDFPDIRLLLLTTYMDKEQIIYLYELGVDSFIVKPVSAQTVLEKLAFALNPLGRIGEVVETAKNLLREGKPEEAKAAAEQILRIKPGSAVGLMALGDAERLLGHSQAARRAYRQACDNSPLFLEPMQKMALLAEENGNLEECLAWLDKMDSLSPLNPDRKVNMGAINLNLGNEAKADRLFQQAMEQARNLKEHIGSLAERIATLYAETDPEKSETFLRRALEAKKTRLTRDDIHIYNHLGISLRRQGKWEEAIEEYRRALDLAPDDAGLHYNMGMAFAQGNKMMEARRSMEAALRHNERFAYTSADVAYNMGAVLLKGAGKELAGRCFAAALEQDPSLDKAREALRLL
ncbi:MAG: tetratricopeptide repeat protein [Desulfovibrio sp.]|jgi:tetratricopeptide (TPR) repeat protein|nr:tetratricopeptide repeat protein [Desulfovibrio sp.]